MKVGDKTYSRAFGKGEIVNITEENYEVKYDKIKVQYPHSNKFLIIAAVCYFLALICFIVFLSYAL